MMSREEYEEKLAALQGLFQMELDSEDQKVWWVDQVRELTYATRPNVKRVHETVRVHEPEVVVFLHFVSICAARAAWAGDTSRALSLVMAHGEMGGYYESMLGTIPDERIKRHLRDAGVERESGKALSEVILNLAPMIQRGWAAIRLLLDVGAESFNAAIIAGLADSAYTEVIVISVWQGMGVAEDRIPREGEPNFDYDEEIAEAASLAPVEAHQAWDQLEELLEEHGIAMRFYDEDDTDER